MISFLKLIRWPNLLLIVISMVFLLLFVISPLLGTGWFVTGLNELEFTLLVLATIFISIGGYLINDFFDMDADRINKPGKNTVGGKWSVSTVQLLYWIFTIAGIVTGATLSWMAGRLNYSLVFVFSAGLLWFYSERYQCIPVVGNAVIGFLSALSFGLVWLFYFFTLSRDADAFTSTQAGFSLVNHFVLIYMGFAFVTGFLREVVKDIEDKEGDERFGCNTFAVAFGQTKGKILAIAIAVIGLTATILTQIYFYSADFNLLLGYFVLIDLAFLITIILLLKAKTKPDFKKVSAFTKLLMFIGILSMLLVYFEV